MSAIRRASSPGAGPRACRIPSSIRLGGIPTGESGYFEVGVKSQFFNDHLRANLAAFDTLYKDVQLNEQEGPHRSLRMRAPPGSWARNWR